jgi:hypothetical protein
MLTAISLALLAGMARPAVQVRLDADDVACPKRAAGRGHDDLTGQFVADHPQVFEIGLVAVVDVIVGPADTDPPDPHQDLARSRDGLVALNDTQRAWFIAPQCSHGLLLQNSKARALLSPRQRHGTVLAVAPPC